MKVIAVVNHKGGVGKTTSVHNLSKALAIFGKKVLMVDNDPQANLTVSCGVKNIESSIYDTMCENKSLPVVPIAERLDLVPAELSYMNAEQKLQAEINGYFRMKKALKKEAKDYDYVLIDCPPSLGILTLNALIAANSILVVVESAFLSVKGLQTIIDVVKDVQEELNPDLETEGLLLTKLNHTVLRREMAETVRNVYPNKVFDTVIRQNVALEEASAAGSDIFEYDSNSNGATDYMQLCKEILHEI
ncbi:ParA family protein [Chondrinema litorale]|uniref:ParA family protein n=1 Tax=Chondrinema litorale TaxID=2994555 RepID=UPI002543CF4D|nr:ParA family protein [Chondrinema litorale]UZR97558.1 ParA family protein [Chondrinema litorale]